MAYTFIDKARTSQSTANPVTVTVPITSDVKLVVASVAITNPSLFPSSVTLDEREMSVATSSASLDGGTIIYYIQNSDIISPGEDAILSIPNSSADDMTVSVSTYSVGSTKNSSLKSAVSANGLTQPTISVTNAGGLIVDSMFSGYNTLFSSSNNRTLIYSTDTGAEICAAQYYINAVEATRVMSYSLLGNDNWNMVAANFEEVNAPTVAFHDTVNYNEIHSIDTQPRDDIRSIDGIIT